MLARFMARDPPYLLGSQPVNQATQPQAPTVSVAPRWRSELGFKKQKDASS